MKEAFKEEFQLSERTQGKVHCHTPEKDVLGEGSICNPLGGCVLLFYDNILFSDPCYILWNQREVNFSVT